MALKKKAQYTTIDLMIADVKAKLGKISTQEWDARLEPSIDDICHTGVMRVFGPLAPFLLDEYWTEELVTETDNGIDISDFDIHTKVGMVLEDPSYGPVPIYRPAIFNEYKHTYGSGTTARPELLMAKFATRTDGVDDVDQLETYRGAGVITPGNPLVLGFTRNPQKTTRESVDPLLDLLEHLCPVATMIATAISYLKAEQKPDLDVMKEITSQEQSLSLKYKVPIRFGLGGY